jgi:hypothetical protein
MNLNAEQQVYLGTLTPGMAAVYAEGADHAYLVRLDNYKRNIVPLVDAELKRMSHTYIQIEPFLAIPNLDTYDVPRTPTGELDLAAYQIAGKILAAEKSRRLWAQILLGLTGNPGIVLTTLLYFSELIEAELPRLSPEQHSAILRMILIRGSAEELHERGALFGWSYAQVESLYTSLAHGLLGFMQANNLISDDKELPTDADAAAVKLEEVINPAGEYLNQFVTDYIALSKRKQGPFVGCIHCLSKCMYRAEVSVLLSSTYQMRISDTLIVQSYETDTERYEAGKQVASYTAQKWLGLPLSTELIGNVPEVAYCAALHVMSWSALNEYELILFSNGLKEYLIYNKAEERQTEDA